MTVLPAPLGARAVVVGGSAWHVVAADVDPSWVAAAVAHDPIAAPLGARFLAALADRVGAEPGSLDAVLVAPPAPAEVAVELVPAELDHPRVRRALEHRSDVRIWSTPDWPAKAYGRPTMTKPWCSRTVWNDVMVVSWPPCC